MASIALLATEAEATAAFYRAIGLRLIDEVHAQGPVHFAVVEDPDGRPGGDQSAEPLPAGLTADC